MVVISKKLLKWLLSSVILTFLLSVYFYAPFRQLYRPDPKYRQDPIEIISSKPDDKIVLYWTTFFESKDFYVGTGSHPFRDCKGGPLASQCLTTYDRRLLNRSDAVVFHIRDMNLADLPAYRWPHQRWIFFLMESPVHTPTFLSSLPNFFNWTMTYRTDSDVYKPYSTIPRSEVNFKFEVHGNETDTWRKLIKGKRKKVAWFVSNCATPSKREQYAALLGKYIDIDVYGACGKLECANRLQCYEMLERDYKFYLAFENSVCVDYVTEKFWNALAFNVLPVVLGGADYQHMVPNTSYIDVRNFKSVEDLAKYLKFLDENDEEYLRYFEWKRHPPGSAALPQTFQPWCSLCEMLHSSSLPHHSYLDIHSWWFDKGHCDKDHRLVDQLLA